MMKGRTILKVLAVIGILVLSSTAAQAGGGGGTPSPLTSFFVCHGISDNVASGALVNVDSSFFGSNPVSITMGSGVLACAFARLLQLQQGILVAIEPNPPVVNPGEQQQMKCYNFFVSRQSPLHNNYNVSDVLLPPDVVQDPVQANQLRFICAPATFRFSFP